MGLFVIRVTYKPLSSDEVTQMTIFFLPFNPPIPSKEVFYLFLFLRTRKKFIYK